MQSAPSGPREGYIAAGQVEEVFREGSVEGARRRALARFASCGQRVGWRIIGCAAVGWVAGRVSNPGWDIGWDNGLGQKGGWERNLGGRWDCGCRLGSSIDVASNLGRWPGEFLLIRLHLRLGFGPSRYGDGE